MKKQIVLLGSLFLGVVYLCGMEECPAPTGEEFVTIVTSDDKKFELPTKLAQKSETISSMVAYQLDEPVVLSLISSQLFQVIKDVLESSGPKRILKKLSLSQLVEFIQGVNFLLIPDLIDASIQELADRDVSQDDVNMLFEQLDSELIKRLWSVHLARNWVLKKWGESAKEIQGKGFVFSPDGRYLVSWDRVEFNTGVVKIWDVNNDFAQVGGDLRQADLFEVIFSPDGKYLVSGGGGGGVKIWDVNNDFAQVGGDLQHEGLGLVIFSPDGRYLVSQGGEAIKIWDVDNNFAQVDGDLQHEVDFLEVTFSPDGRYLVSWNGVVKIWDVNNNFAQVGADIQHEHVFRVTFSPDGRYLVSKSRGAIKIWDVDNNFAQVVDGDLRRETDLFEVIFSPDGRYLVSQSRSLRTVKIWDVNNNFEQVGDDLRHEHVLGVTFNPDGRYLVSRGGTIIKVWDVNNNFEQVGNDLRQSSVITSIVFSPDGRYLVSSGEDVIKIWDVNNNFEQVGADLQHVDVFSVTFSPDGRYLVLQGGGAIKIWDMNILQQVVYPSESEIHLFLLAYVTRPRGFGVFTQKPMLPFQLRQKFVHLSPEMKEFLKTLAPQFKNEFETAEKSFGID